LLAISCDTTERYSWWQSDKRHCCHLSSYPYQAVTNWQEQPNTSHDMLVGQLECVVVKQRQKQYNLLLLKM